MIHPRKTMCATCPFREGSEHAHLAPYLGKASLEESRICHSTGSNAINEQTNKPERLCRGSRDIQLNLFYGMGFLEAPTDEAWENKCTELNITN